MKKTKPSLTDWALRIPGYVMLLGFLAEYDFAKSRMESPDFIIGDKTIPVFASIGYAGLAISLLPYAAMIWNAFNEWRGNGSANSSKG